MKRCLIADSSEIIRKVAKRFVEDLGFEALESNNAAEALDTWQQKAPEVILLDWHLPGMTTVEFLSALRFSGSAKRPLIVYWTTDNDPVDITRAFAAGASAYLLKPFDRQSIAEKFIEAGLTA